MNCRFCAAPLTHLFLDLGFAPPSNAYLSEDDLNRPEVYYPLKIKVCDLCWLVQTEDYAEADALFTSEYAYFSSTSRSWLEHARNYATTIIEELVLDDTSFVIEIASNDGYLLKNFVELGIPCLGVEPTDGTADAAELSGVPVLRAFFSEELGKRLASNGKCADLIAGNNVFAHVPDINDFTRGLKSVLKPNGVITLEFPHLMRFIEFAQFDTAYHEHFSYLSLHTVGQIFNASGLKIWRVEEMSTHGGSLRIYGCHKDASRVVENSVHMMTKEEKRLGLQEIKTYREFQPRADKIKNDLLSFLVQQKQKGKKVVAYGAAAKGNTLLNYGGVKKDLLQFVFDASPSKQNKYLPGSHIPILSPDRLKDERPDFVLILPWNIVEEVRAQNSFIEKNGARFVTAVPELKVL